MVSNTDWVVNSKRATSIVLRPEKPITPHALFLKVHPIPTSALYCSPEVYPRPDGTVYVCGISAREAAVPLPQRASAVVHSEKSAQLLREQIEMIAPEAFGPGASVEVVAEQACYLPESSETGAPVIGEIEKGLVYFYIVCGGGARMSVSPVPPMLTKL